MALVNSAKPISITVVHDSWRPRPLAWIHRAEARSVAEELRNAGYAIRLVRYRADEIAGLPSGPMLLRLSDPVMCTATRVLTGTGTSFIGPSAYVMKRCYDKYEAYRIATARGIDCPATALANDADTLPFPLVFKPRKGSDSIGVRLLRRGPLLGGLRSDGYIVQEYVRGAELTLAVLRGRVGTPLQILLPDGTLYSFARKYVLRPGRTTVTDVRLAERVRRVALEIFRIFDVHWAARIDLIHETATDRLRFLECDVAPLIGARSSFAASLEAAGMGRAEQLRILLDHS